MAIKRFGDATSTAKRVEFEVDFEDQARVETHAFAAYADIDAVELAKINKAAALPGERGAVNVVLMVKDAIRKMLDDADGTPSDWRPTTLPADVQLPQSELTTGWPEDEVETLAGDVSEAHPDVLDTPQFLAPDGTVRPLAEASKFEAFEAGSSRRRWIELVDGDNNLTLKATVVMKIWRWLIGEAADRPTVR